jgi:ABC-type glycerol-3-phosphate transport system permease component
MESVMNRNRRWYNSALMIILLLALSFFFLLPLIYMVSRSFMPASQISKYPPEWIPNPWTLRSFEQGLSTGMIGDFFKNSVIITVLNIIGVLFSSSLVAFGFACLKSKLKNFLFLLLLSTMMIPNTVTLIPMFVLYSNFKLVDTYFPLVMMAFLGGGAFNIFLLRQFFLAIPNSLAESARLDGCGWGRIYWNIYLPNAKSALLVVTMFTFVNCWNDYFGPMIYLTSPSKYTVAIGLNLFKSQFGTTDIGPLMAMAFLTVLPILIIYVICQKYFVQGIVTTGMKM